jgi:hypothetical protein
MTEQFEKQITRLKTVLNLELPASLLDRIVIVFKDSDENNWTVENLSYRFKDGPLPCPFYPGFYYIPGFSRYVIDRSGTLTVVRTTHQIKWSVTLPGKNGVIGGYRAASIISDQGRRKGISRHRVLCIVFKDYQGHLDDLWVNHKNGVPGDDRLDNLEFCTPSQNVKHAYDHGLHSHKTVAVDIWNWKTDEKLSFTTMQTCADHLNLNHAFISSRLKAGNNKRFEDGWRFKRQVDDWLPLNDRVGAMSTNIDVFARHIYTNQVWVFGSIADAARHTGIGDRSVRKHAVTKPMIPLNGWNFRYVRDYEGWPQYTEQHLAIFRDRPKKGGDGIEVFDLETNEMLFFTSDEAAGKHFGISPITASKLARYEGTRAGRYKFKLFKVRETLMVPSLSN